jgi:hypothetical protein
MTPILSISSPWLAMSPNAFDSKGSKNVSMAFLQSEVTDLYNNGMSNIDITNQLQGTY